MQVRGDSLVNNFKKIENATVMGLTTSNGINQNNGGICYTTGGDFCITYPIALTLDENAKPLIDTKSDRKSKIDLDEKIPLTREAAEIIFSDSNRDYELEYAVKRFSVNRAGAF